MTRPRSERELPGHAHALPGFGSDALTFLSEDFIGVSRYDIGAILKPEFVDAGFDRCADARPLMRFPCAALEFEL